MTIYTQIPASARELFSLATMDINQASRAFFGSFSTPEALAMATASIERAEENLRLAREALS